MFERVEGLAERDHDKSLCRALASPFQPGRVGTAGLLPHMRYRNCGVRQFLCGDRSQQSLGVGTGNHYSVVAQDKVLERPSYLQRLSGQVPSCLQLWILGAMGARQVQGIPVGVGCLDFLRLV